MDGLSGAASIIAVIDISVKIASLCSKYYTDVKDAKDEIERLRRKTDDVAHILKQIEQLYKRQDSTALSTTQGLSGSLEQCLEELKTLETKLDPGKARKTMSRVGLRALKWPFTSKQVDKIVTNLEQYVQTFSLALQVDQTAVVINIDQKLDLTKLPVAQGASYNSHADEHNARCLPNTRTALLQDIANWAQDKHGKPMFWLSGMAGTGKSTIARTIAETFASHGQLGASFFFKRGEGERGNASRFFTTIATYLATQEPGMLPGIRKALDEDPNISHKTLKEQFENLILQPLLEIKALSSQTSARVIVIDALDECEREADVRTILQLLARTKDIRPVPLRVMVTSRPEFHIRLGFREMTNGTYQDLILHEVPRSTIEHDIRLFLEHELSEIRNERRLPSEWPSKQQILALVELAVPLFIYAATVCRYIRSKGSNPTTFLAKVLQYQKTSFSQLDQAYLPILNQLLSEQEDDEKDVWLQTFREIVGSIVVLESPLSTSSLGGLLGIPKEEIQYRLDPLHSVLSIPDNEKAPVRLLHLSFREFLVDPQKQGKIPFWVDEKATHKNLASRCLEVMSKPSGLRQDMCSLPGPGTLRSEIDEARITDSLSPDLLYACRYWIDHLKQSQQEIFDGDTIHLFLKTHFLHWLEAMSLTRESSRCVRLLTDLQKLAHPSSTLLAAFLHDAKRFMLRFQLILTDAPLQIYCSALMFAPEASLVRRTFMHKVPLGFEVPSPRETDWDACYSTLECDSSAAAVAFSPDGQLVVSASGSVLELWEADTGSRRSTLEGHRDSVVKVVFSPDGQLLASASSEDVRLWDVATGTCRHTFKENLERVQTLAFLSEGQLLGSAYEKAVQLWDVKTGTCHSVLKRDSFRSAAFSPNGQLVAMGFKNEVQLYETETGILYKTFKGPFKGVIGLKFSPNGQLVVSASRDRKVRLWETKSGTCRATFKSFSDRITMLAFSPNGQLIALVSEYTAEVWDVEKGTYHSIVKSSYGNSQDMALSPDGHLIVLAFRTTVQLWETATGKCYNTFEGHSGEVIEVAFSPNGRAVVSAYQDATVRLWEVTEKEYRGTFESHSDKIASLVFSPDGELIASASWDQTLRLWEVATGTCRNILEGHSSMVMAAVFSPDGELIASASYDNTVRLWEVATGTCRSLLEGHSGGVEAVVFSPDGELIASASYDNTVRLWEVATGTCRNRLEGHFGRVGAVVFSPDGQLIASASYDNTVRLWEAATGLCRNTISICYHSELTLYFSPDSQVLHTPEGGFPLTTDSLVQSFPGPRSPSSHLRFEYPWILRNRQRFLWLPPEYRAEKSCICGDIVCLGLGSGRVIFFRIT